MNTYILAPTMAQALQYRAALEDPSSYTAAVELPRKGSHLVRRIIVVDRAGLSPEQAKMLAERYKSVEENAK